MAATLVASFASTAGIAAADTTGNPDPVATANFGAQSNVPSGGTVTGLSAGNTVTVHVQAGASSTISSADVRLCKTGLNPANVGDLSPSGSGNCLPSPFVAGTDDNFVSVFSASPNTSVDVPFRVGKGSKTFAYSGGTSTITCNSLSPCDLWAIIHVPAAVSSDGSGFVLKHFTVNYVNNTVAPGAPASTTASVANQAATVNWTAPTSVGGGPIAGYIVTLSGGPTTPTSPQTVSAATLSQVFNSLTNFTTYTASVQAFNLQDDGTTRNVGPTGPTPTVTPQPTSAPTGVSGTPGDQKVDLSWTAPAASGSPTPSGYEITATPTTGAPIVQNSAGTATTYTFTPLTNGTVYTFTVRANYGGTNFGPASAASGPITPNGTFVTQTITVTRPQGALVLTQICGASGATTTGTAPTFGSGADPLFSQYPYPTDSNGVPIANYPTNCALNMGTAHLLTSGTGAGQFFEATAVLNQVTVVETRDTDPVWNVNGQMGTFTSGSNSFSGSQMGWTPIRTSQSPSFTDSNGVTYAQNVTAGAVVLPNTPNTTGLSNGAPLASAPAGAGLGIARLDANLKLWIPIRARNGTYTGVLTITAI